MDIKALRRSHSSQSLPVAGKTADPVKTTLTLQLTAKELSPEALEALMPVLNCERGKPLAPSAGIDELWGAAPKKPLPPKLQRTAEQLHQLERKLAEVAAKVEEGFKSSDVNAQLAVLDSLANDTTLSPWLQRCFARYAKLMRGYVASADGQGAAKAAEIHAKLKEVIARATQRAKDNGAHVELLKTVEEQQGVAGSPYSFTALLDTWFNLWSVFRVFMADFVAGGSGTAMDPVSREQRNIQKREHIQLERLREELVRKANGQLLPSPEHLET